jgi:DNA sulfur modification protein DndE
VVNPPSSTDKPVVDQIARIGIILGTPFNWGGLNATMRDAIDQGFQDAASQVNAASINPPSVIKNNGWNIYYSGPYGTNYTQRAGMALGYLFTVLPQDALYPISNTTATGIPYSGANNYVLHFANNGTPPVNAFWSVTLYDSQGYVIPNPINRYTIAPHLGNVTYNPDGSLDIYIQNASPGDNKESNWLPAPSGAFQLALRLYWPQDSALNGSWVPPGIQQVE